MYSVSAAHDETLKAVVAVADDGVALIFFAMFLHNLLLLFGGVGNKLALCLLDVTDGRDSGISRRLGAVKGSTAEIGLDAVFIGFDKIDIHLFKQFADGVLLTDTLVCTPAVLNDRLHAAEIGKNKAFVRKDKLPKGKYLYSGSGLLDYIGAVVTDGINGISRHKIGAVRQRTPVFAEFSLRHSIFKFFYFMIGDAAAKYLHIIALLYVLLYLGAKFGKSLGKSTGGDIITVAHNIPLSVKSSDKGYLK